MNLLTSILTSILTMTWQQTWELIAWTMCYFLAAGTVVALAGALLRFLCKSLAPQIRYIVSLAVFATLAALPFGIAIWLSPSIPAAIAPTPVVIDLAHMPITMSPLEEPIELINITVAEAPTPEAVPLVVALARQNDTALVERLVERAIKFLPWLWLIGTPLTFLLLATGLIGSNRLRRQCTRLTEGPITKTCERLRSTLAISQRVGIAINDRIATPLLIGIVRPLILLPPAALTGWSPEEIEMVLLHELAHVRRWDNLVNFGQRLVESLLFFHPAVWWVSRWVRRDREECCDAVVVARTAKPQAYAELLVALATPPTSLSSPPLAGLAMAQHPLAGRIRRILHLEEEKMLITRSTLGLVGFFVVALLGIVLWQPTASTLAEESPTEVAEQKEVTTEDTESTEETAPTSNLSFLKLLHKSPQGLMYQFQLPNELDRSDRFSAAKLEIWQETQRALIKSQFVLRKAIQSMAKDNNAFPLPDEIWLQDNLEVEFQGELLRVRIKGKKHAGKNEKALSYYIETVMEIYEQDLEVNQQLKEEAQPSPFPTLEAQRSADLAYKLLGVELEQLDKEELARVKTMKFAGGLRVAHTEMSRKGLPLPLNFALPGDLLVGLHVWPTTSLAEVQKILEREDLEDLSPLKFYVIRKSMDGPGSPNHGKYLLVTGRIEVNIDAVKKAQKQQIRPYASLSQQTTQPAQDQTWGRIDRRVIHPRDPRIVPPISDRYDPAPRWQPKLPKRSVLKSNVPLKPHVLAPGDSVKVVATGAYPDQPIDDVYVIEEMGTLALGPTYGRVKVVGLTLLKAEEKVLGKLRAAVGDDMKENVRVQITLVSKAGSKTKGVIPIRDSSGYSNKTTFLYEGKDFAHWRDLWQYELSTDKRIVAIQALAAFGRAGHGKEAATTILDVAGEYDFMRSSGNTPKNDLKQAIKTSLYGEDGVPVDDWIPILLQRLEKEPRRWSGLTSRVLLNPNVHSEHPDIQSLLLIAAKAPHYPVEARGAALRALANSDSNLKNESTVTLLRSALTGEESHLITSALAFLNFHHLDKLPEQLELFFHADESVRSTANGAFVRTGSAKTSSQVLQSLLAVLGNPQQAEKHRWVLQHIAGIHGLFNGGLSTKRAKVIAQLRDILVNGDSTLLPDTIFVLGRLTAEVGALVVQHVDHLVSQQRREELAAALEAAEKIRRERSSPFGGRSGGGGGAF